MQPNSFPPRREIRAARTRVYINHVSRESERIYHRHAECTRFERSSYRSRRCVTSRVSLSTDILEDEDILVINVRIFVSFFADKIYKV